MKKSTKIALSLVVGTLLLNGCSSSSSSDGNTDTPPAVPTDVTVERGAVYDANVTDAKGQVAESNNTNGYSNVYRFADTPTYPISVNGGWIDVDGDKNMTMEDIKLDFTMKSYSDVVTPITTYIADPKETKREEKLNELVKIIKKPDSNLTINDLKKLPSKSLDNVIIMQNIIYKLIKENNNTVNSLDKNNIGEGYYQFSYSKPAKNDNENYNLTVEKQIISELNTDGKVKHLDPNYLYEHGKSIIAKTDNSNLTTEKIADLTVSTTTKDDTNQTIMPKIDTNTTNKIIDDINSTTNKIADVAVSPNDTNQTTPDNIVETNITLPPVPQVPVVISNSNN